MNACEESKSGVPTTSDERERSGALDTEEGVDPVAKMAEFRNVHPLIFPVEGVAKIPEYRNTAGGDAEPEEGDEQRLTRSTLAPDEVECEPAIPPPVFSRRGRPAAITPQLRERLCVVISMGLSRRRACAYLGLDHTTLSHTLGRDEEFGAELRRAEEICRGRPLLAMFAAVQKSWRAAAWLLEEQRKYGPRQEEPQTEEEMAQKLVETRRKLAFSQMMQEVREEAAAAESKRKQEKESARRQAEIEAMNPKRKRKPTPAESEPGSSPPPPR